MKTSCPALVVRKKVEWEGQKKCNRSSTYNTLYGQTFMKWISVLWLIRNECGNTGVSMMWIKYFRLRLSCISLKYLLGTCKLYTKVVEDYR